jgi:plastocyanin
MARGIRFLVIGGCAMLLAQCGSSGPSSPGGGAATIEITAAGPNPRQVTVAAGSRVTFTNKDSRQHAVSSDPIQVHTDCPGVNDVGTLNPGESRSTGVLSVARTCGFHDHNNETDPTFKGTIIVQ